MILIWCFGKWNKIKIHTILVYSSFLTQDYGPNYTMEMAVVANRNFQ